MHKTKSFRELDNPFIVQYPEDLSAEDATHLFVDVFSDFPKIKSSGHAFLHGPRGSGKSMMFRFLEPDCQCYANECDLSDLEFYSLWIQVKRIEFNLPELERLEKRHASFILNEHYFISIICEILFSALKQEIPDEYRKKTGFKAEIKTFYDSIISLLDSFGWASTSSLSNPSDDLDYLEELHKVSKDVLRQFKMYHRELAYNLEPIPYCGPILTYLDYLFPVLSNLKECSFMPNGPIYLLIDDADNLNLTQTKVLNSWVATRTSSIISIKISTQLKYKTYFTSTGDRIETPHDYSEVNISTIYTTKKTHYINRIREITKRRLKCYDIKEAEPEAFFPENKEQEEKIKQIKEKCIADWEKSGRGYCASDDATRYARPDYMKSLAGTSKSGPTYSYAGFEQLVHVSSGIIRYFLDAAAKMYATVKAENPKKEIKSIPQGIQDSIIKKQAVEVMHNEFDKLRDDKDETSPDEEDLIKLSNLLEALGGMFHMVLMSERSERRVFSIALSNKPDSKLRGILKLGVQTGYLHESSIGNKEGTGRTRLFILSRRLAPYFKLDPTSFAGYLFVTNDLLWEGIINPPRMLRTFLKRLEKGEIESRQLILFE